MPTLPLLLLTLELLSTQVHEMPRVRSENPFIAAAIASATERSVTFEQLLMTIQGTDGLVYVEKGPCGHGVQACLSLSIKVAGPFRLLRIRVDPRRSGCALMTSIGHELQHAIEVLSDPHVTDIHSMYWFFERQGSSGLGRFETEAAIHVGLQIGKETCGR
jgi:hypothetical protein